MLRRTPWFSDGRPLKFRVTRHRSGSAPALIRHRQTPRRPCDGAHDNAVVVGRDAVRLDAVEPALNRKEHAARRAEDTAVFVVGAHANDAATHLAETILVGNINVGFGDDERVGLRKPDLAAGVDLLAVDIGMGMFGDNVPRRHDKQLHLERIAPIPQDGRHAINEAHRAFERLVADRACLRQKAFEKRF